MVQSGAGSIHGPTLLVLCVKLCSVSRVASTSHHRW